MLQHFGGGPGLQGVLFGEELAVWYEELAVQLNTAWHFLEMLTWYGQC